MQVRGTLIDPNGVIFGRTFSERKKELAQINWHEEEKKRKKKKENKVKTVSTSQ